MCGYRTLGGFSCRCSATLGARRLLRLARASRIMYPVGAVLHAAVSVAAQSTADIAGVYQHERTMRCLTLTLSVAGSARGGGVGARVLPLLARTSDPVPFRCTAAWPAPEDGTDLPSRSPQPGKIDRIRTRSCLSGRTVRGRARVCTYPPAPHQPTSPACW